MEGLRGAPLAANVPYQRSPPEPTTKLPLNVPCLNEPCLRPAHTSLICVAPPPLPSWACLPARRACLLVARACSLLLLVVTTPCCSS